jgi:isopentenyl phosphate kinase
MADITSSRINPLWLLKIGGSIISTNTSTKNINVRLLRQIAIHLKTKRPLIIVHGTGYESKEFARTNRILKGVIASRQQQTALQCLAMLRRIHFRVLKVLTEEGLRVVSLSPFAFCAYRHGRIKILNVQFLRLMVEEGFVPLIHGDLVIDEVGTLHVCSSDDLIACLASEFPTDRLMFATDVNGVFPKDPKRFAFQEHYDFLTLRMLGTLSRAANDQNDVSGAMPAKLKAIRKVTRYFNRCYIFNGNSRRAWHALFNQKKDTGTLIRGTL